jgi:hypothetical protein
LVLKALGLPDSFLNTVVKIYKSTHNVHSNGIFCVNLGVLYFNVKKALYKLFKCKKKKFIFIAEKIMNNKEYPHISMQINCVRTSALCGGSRFTRPTYKC